MNSCLGMPLHGTCAVSVYRNVKNPTLSGNIALKQQIIIKPNMASYEGEGGDIRRHGIMKKLKTMKKKYFVLRAESDTGPARLEYYDSEKKYRSSGRPKRAINLRSCLNINKRFDTKHKCAIVLYTKDDCFSVLAENEEEQERWLLAMRELQAGTTDDGEPPKPAFEHVWELTVKPRGLGSSKNLTGQYRLCLTDRDVALVKVNHELPAIVFQLPSVRRCGHSDCFFFMEVGRSAPTGAGELWMQVEDTVIAQNMHEAILSSMTAVNAMADMPSMPRPRSHTTSSRDGTKPISVPIRGPNPVYHQDSQGPKRSRTISEGTYPSPRRPRFSPSRKPSNSSDLGRPNSMYGRSTSVPMGVQVNSPVGAHPLSAEPFPGHRSRSDSTDSHGTSSSVSMDDSDIDHISSGHLSSHSHSTTPEHPILEEKEDYFSMTPSGGSHAWKEHNKSRSVEGYMDMSLSTSQTSHSSLGVSPSTDGKENYLDMSMSPISVGSKDEETPYLDMGKVAPSGKSGDAPGKPEEDSGYLDMHPVGQSLPTVQEKAAQDGYLDMRPVGQNPVTLPQGLMKMDKVLSYLHDEPSEESFPKRAYSVGSRAQVLARSAPKNQSYMELVARQGSLDKLEGKSSSAPHLTAEQTKNQSRNQSSRGSSASGSCNISQESLPGKVKKEGERERSLDLEGRNNPDLFMEMDFTRPRTASDSYSYRPRTGSFASREMRPRSSSHGHRSNLKSSLRSQSSSRASSQGEISHKSSKESLPRSKESSLKGSVDSLKKSSHESLSKLSQHSDYLDMSTKASTSPSAALTKSLKKKEKKQVKSTVTQVVRPKPTNYMAMGFADPSKSESAGSATKEASDYASMGYSKKDFSSPGEQGKPPFPEVSHVRSHSTPVEQPTSNYMAMDQISQSSKLTGQGSKVTSPMSKATHHGVKGGARAGGSRSKVMGQSSPGSGQSVKGASSHESKTAKSGNPSPLTSTPKTTSSSSSLSSSLRASFMSPAPEPASPISPTASGDVKQIKGAAKKPMKPLPVCPKLPAKPSEGASGLELRADQQKSAERKEIIVQQKQTQSRSRGAPQLPVAPGQFDDAPVDSYMVYKPGTDISEVAVSPGLLVKQQSPLVTAEETEKSAGTTAMAQHDYMNVSLGHAKDSLDQLGKVRMPGEGKLPAGSVSDRSIMALVQPSSPKPSSPKPSGMVPRLPLPKRGSTSSVSSFTEGVTGASGKDGPGLVIAAHSNPNVSKPGERRSLTEVSPYENLTFKFPHGGAVGSEQELNYASLDLRSSDDPDSTTPRSPRINKSRNPSGGDGDESPLFYAEIDFAKSEGLRNTSTSHREHRLSLDALMK